MSELSLINDVLRVAGLPPPLVATACTDLRECTRAFEYLRCYSDYRTPSTIRSIAPPAGLGLGKEGGGVRWGGWVDPEPPLGGASDAVRAPC